MGMFDTIHTLPTDPIICPGCDTPYYDFQTKDLDCLLDDYYEGEETVYDYGCATKHHARPNPRNRFVLAYEYCSVCDGMLYQNFEFDKRGRVSRIRDAVLEINLGRNEEKNE